MSNIVGGLRDRLISDNIRNMIEDSLRDLGWYDVGRKHRSVTVRAEPATEQEEILPNMVMVFDENLDSDELETGSNLTEFRWQYAVDIFAESTAVGKHLAGDIRAIIEGRFNSIGRIGAELDILDLTLATPTAAFHVEFENVVVGRQRLYTKPFQKYWWTILFDVVDWYADEIL